jgi:CheY-like chemotaxis protein
MLGGKLILIADDYEPDTVYLQRSLRKAGIVNPVIWLEDGETTIRYLRGEPPYSERERYPLPGVLFLDLKMPRRDGFEVLSWHRTQPHLQEILIIVLSGYDEMQQMSRAYELGADTFLVKPGRPEELLELIKHFPAPWEFGTPENGPKTLTLA